MHKRITAIIGAGAVLNFDFSGEKPTTSKIKKELMGISISNKQGKRCELIKLVDKMISSRLLALKKIGLAIPEDEFGTNFEILFHVLEMLYSDSLAWSHADYPFSWVGTLVNPRRHLRWLDKDSYRQALVESIKIITKVIDAYDTPFERKEIKEDWYREFWKGFGSKLDVFTFNYDNTIENSVVDYEDGFIDYNPELKRFEPERLWNSADLINICHLHGNIRYTNAIPPSRRAYGEWDLFKCNKFDIKKTSESFFPKNQARDVLLYAPITTGLHKLEKLCFMPQSFYHSYLVNKLIDNHALLIVGYSFGDLYVNQLLEKHWLIHQDKQRIVIITKWDLKDDDLDTMIEYVLKNTSFGFRSFLFHVLCDSYYSINNQSFEDNLKRYLKTLKNDGYSWRSDDKRILIFYKELKEAVDNHKQEIMEFLLS